MKRISLLVFAIVHILTTVSAQSSYWEETQGPYGGNFSLVKAPGDTLYAYHQANWKKTYRSTDNGLSWQQLTFLQQFFPNEPVKYVTVSEAGSIYVRVPGYSTYKTTNDGQTWTGSYSFSVELASGVMLREESSSITRSTNGGLNWTTVLNFPSGILTNSELINTPFGGLLYVCQRTLPGGDITATLYRSFDEGATWVSQDIPHAFEFFYCASPNLILCVKQDTLYRSVDGGATLESTGLAGLYAPNCIKLPSGRLLMDGSYYSDDAGASWEPFDGGGGYYVQIAPMANGTIFKAHENCVMRSKDGGMSWQFSSAGMRANPVSRLTFVSDSIYYAHTAIGLWKTTDSGENWGLLDINNIAAKQATVYEVTSSGGVLALQQEQLYWSADGNGFMEITPPSGLSDSYSANLAVNPQNGHIFIRTLQGLERSVNFGQTWELLSDSLNLVAGIGFHPSGRLITCHDYTEILVSDDNGNTWSARPNPGDPFASAIRVAPNGTVYLLVVTSTTEVFLWRSEDAGDTWVKLPPALKFNLWWKPILEIAGNGHLFSAAGQDISLSATDGLTWQNLPNPADSTYVAQNAVATSFNSLALSPGQHLFAGLSDFDLYKSINPVSLGATIEGFVKIDGDDDCATEDSQAPLQNRTVSAQGDGFTYFTKTDQSGWYRFFVDTGLYSLTIQNTHNIWWEYCNSPQDVDIPAYYSTDTLNFSAIALSECPLLSVNVAAPSLRRCFNNPVYVQFCNLGSETAESAYVDIFLDPYLDFISSNQPHNDLGNKQIRFFVGDLASGDCGQFSFTTYVNCDSTVLGQTHCISAHGFPDTLCNSVPDWSGANINASVSCQDSILQFELHNTGTGASQVLDYIIIEDDVVMVQGQQQYTPNQSISIPVTANGHTYRIESEQEPGHPFSTRAIAFEEGCGGFESLGFINQFSVNGITPSWHRVCRENTGSYDPNDKHGYPLGTGTDNRIRPGQALEYMIRFQNTGTDTAFTVVIRDTLSAWLDPASIIPGAASHPYTWQLQGSGEISFTFSNILLPDSTTNLAGSQGFVTFSVAQQPGVPLGAQILNSAAIYFDFNAPVITNETRHTVGLPDVVSSTQDFSKSKSQNPVQVSPNPARDHVRFQLTNGQFKGHRLQLFNPMGTLVYESVVSGNQIVVPRGKLPAGAYGWRVADARGKLTGAGVLVFQ